MQGFAELVYRPPQALHQPLSSCFQNVKVFSTLGPAFFHW